MRSEYFGYIADMCTLGSMSNSRKLPPQVLHSLLQQQVAELCSQDAVNIMHFLDLVIAIKRCEAEMDLDRRPS
jgi:hypothetical protein